MKLIPFGIAATLLLPVAAIAQDVVQQPLTTPPSQVVTSDQDRTISWYIQHTTERKARIQVCDNDPGHLANDPDCINAKKADNQAGVNDFKQGVDNTVQGAADFFHKF